MSPITLPSPLFDTYKCYKNGTTAFIRWLSAQDHKEGAPVRAYVKSVDELRWLANSVLSRRIMMPTSLLWGLKDTIRARTQVSKFFKSLAGPGDKEITSSHEHFTRTLLHIHREFQGLAKASRPSSTGSEKISPAKQPSNVFEFLGFDDCITSDDDQSVADNHEIQSKRVVLDCGCVKYSTVQESDNIGEFMALAMYLSQLDNLMAVVREAWEKAAFGMMPIAVAASTTSMAYRAAQGLEKDLEEYDIYNPQHFLARYTTCLRTLNLSGSSSLETSRVPPELAPFRDRKGPQQGWSALAEFRKFWKANGSVEYLQKMDDCKCCRDSRPCSFPWDHPVDFLGKKTCSNDDGEKQIDLDGACLDLVLKRMGQLLTLKNLDHGYQIPFHTPLIQELCYFLESKKNVSEQRALHTLSLSFGLELLVQSLKSYYRPPEGDMTAESTGSNDKEPLPPTRPAGCRVQSLKFAMEVLSGLAHLMKTPNAPCGCLKIGSLGVANLLITSQVLLSNFVENRRFDIFYQAPWISGQHMIENLARASDFGLKAWHHAYYVGTTLHIYHTLLRLEVIKPTDFPVMERLCNIFEDTVFLGHRPSRNLWSCYQRWSGGCLIFPKGRCNGMHTHSHSSGIGKKWNLKYVKDVSQGGNHPIRGFNPMKISLFSLVVTRNFALDDDVLAWTYCSKPWKKAMKKDIQVARGRRDSVSFLARTVEAVQERILDEFQGDFPVARINSFAIYELCVQILQTIHKAEHPTQDLEHICSCVSGRLLSAADEYLDDLRVFKACQERQLVEECKQGFAKAFKDKSFDDYLWPVTFN